MALTPVEHEKATLAALAIKAGYTVPRTQEGFMRFCTENTLKELKSKIHRMIDTEDVPASKAGRELVFKLML